MDEKERKLESQRFHFDGLYEKKYQKVFIFLKINSVFLSNYLFIQIILYSESSEDYSNLK